MTEPLTDEQLAQMRRTVESDLPFSGRKRLIARLDAAERQLETAHTIMAINEQAYTERVCELHAAEAEVARLRAERDRWEEPEYLADWDSWRNDYQSPADAAPPDPKEPSE